MTFEEFLCEVKNIRCQETRAWTDKYCEVVVASADLEAMAVVLQSYFGPPLKPKGERPSKEANAFAEPYGGIFDSQTMYFHKNGQGSELALLWPWGSGLSVTVKIIKE